MSDKKKGLFQKYNVERVDGKELGDCIVLQFKDPIAHEALWEWAENMRQCGYYQVYSDTIDKLNQHGFPCYKHKQHEAHNGDEFLNGLKEKVEIALGKINK